jgi:hypothetical protein
MLTKFSILLCLVCAIVLVGCAKSEPTSETPGANANKAPAANTPASNAPVATAGDKIGVPECDEFIANYDACITSKVPEAARAQYKAGIEQWRTSWKKLAENPQTKASLAAACKQSAEQTQAAMKSYGCTF